MDQDKNQMLPEHFKESSSRIRRDLNNIPNAQEKLSAMFLRARQLESP